jgi:hypothetical protein
LNDDLLNDFLLESFPNPERKGCPDDETLKAYAEDRLPPGNPVLPHISSCSECYREYLHYRQDWKESRGIEIEAKPAPVGEPIPFSPAKRMPSSEKSFRRWAIAAGLVVLLGGGLFFAVEHRPAPTHGALVAADSTPFSMNVDLFNAVTTRGSSDEPTPLEQVSLPSSVVNLSVTLPRFSESGPYQVLVSKDRAANEVVARGVGQASETDKKVTLSVSLDLRHAAPGMYFLATVRGSDNGTYYYPLRIK